MNEPSTTEPAPDTIVSSERVFQMTESALILLMNESYQHGWRDGRHYPNSPKPFQLQPVLEINDGEVTNFRAVRR